MVLLPSSIATENSYCFQQPLIVHSPPGYYNTCHSTITIKTVLLYKTVKTNECWICTKIKHLYCVYIIKYQQKHFFLFKEVTALMYTVAGCLASFIISSSLSSSLLLCEVLNGMTVHKDIIYLPCQLFVSLYNIIPWSCTGLHKNGTKLLLATQTIIPCEAIKFIHIPQLIFLPHESSLHAHHGTHPSCYQLITGH